MKSSPVYSPYTALALKVVGLILIISSLVDYIFLAMPLNLGQRAGQILFASQIVDRGIIPMVGIAFLLVGYWVESNTGNSSERRPLVRDWRFWALWLSSLLGALFLVLAPVHAINVIQERDAALKQIEQQAGQAQKLLEAQKQQVDTLIKDPQRLSELEKVINSGQVQGEQLAQLKALREKLNAFKKDPNTLTQEAEAAQTRLSREKQQKEAEANTKVWQIGVRTVLSSLLLAIGYITIGWTGLRGSRG